MKSDAFIRYRSLSWKDGHSPRDCTKTDCMLYEKDHTALAKSSD